ELTVPRATRIRGTSAIRIHRASNLDPRDVTRRGLFIVTRPLRTLIDLAGVLSKSKLEDALDDVLRKRLVPFDALTARIDPKQHGTSGMAVLRRLVSERRPNEIAESSWERKLRTLIV